MNILWQVVHTSDNGVEEEGLATKRKDEDRPKKDNQCRQETENNLFGGAVRAGMAVKELAPVEQEKSGREEGEGGGKRKWEDAVPACSAKTEMSREERKMQQQLEIFKKMEMLQANARGGGGGSGKRESEGGATSRGAGERVVDRSMDARRDDSTGADVARAMEREKERERERKREREREREREEATNREREILSSQESERQEKGGGDKGAERATTVFHCPPTAEVQILEKTKCLYRGSIVNILH